MAELTLRIKAEYESAIKCRQELDEVVKKMKALNENSSPKEIEGYIKKYAELSASYEKSISFIGKTGAYIEETWKGVSRSLQYSVDHTKNLGTSAKDVIDNAQKRLQLEENILDTLKKQREEAVIEKNKAAKTNNDKVDELAAKREEFDKKYHGQAESFYDASDKAEIDALKKDIDEAQDKWENLNAQVMVFDEMIELSKSRTEKMTETLKDMTTGNFFEDMTSEVANSESEIDSYRNTLATLKVQLNELQDAEGAKIKIGEIEKSIDEKNEEIEATQNLIDKQEFLQTSVEGLTNAVKGENDAIEYLKKQQEGLSESSEKYAQIQNEIDYHNDELAKNTKLLEDAKVALDDTDKALEKGKSLEVLNNELDNLTKKYEHVKSVADNDLINQQAIENTTQQITEMEAKISAADEKLNMMKDTLTETSSVYTGFANAAESASTKVFLKEETFERYNELKQIIEDTKKEIEKKTSGEFVDVQELERLQKKLAESQEEFRALDSAARQAAEGMGASLAERISQSLENLYRLNKGVRDTQIEVTKTSVALENAKRKLSEAKEPQAIILARQEVDRLKDSLDKANDRLSTYKAAQTDALNEYKRITKQIKNDSSEMSGFVNGVFKNIAAVAGVSFSVSQAKSFAKEVVSIRTAMQDLETSTKIFLGSEEKAAQFNDKLREYSMHSLFHYNELMSVSHQMLALGMNTDEAMQKIDQLSNIAAATHARLSTVVSMYTRAQTMGSVMNRQLVTWNNLGINVKEILKEMGEDATKSTISFEQLSKVIDHVTKPGGKFANAQSEMLGNISAEIDTYKNKMELMFNEIGKEYQDYIVKSIQFGQSLVDNYKNIGSIIMDCIAAYGAYRAALIAASAAQKAHVAWETASATATRINTVAKTGQVASITTGTVAWRTFTASIRANTTAMLSNAAAAVTNPYVLLGAAVAGLTFAVYKLATAEDAETAARRRANEEMDEFKNKLEERKSRISSYIDVLHDSAATETQQAIAWENLKKEAPSLVEGYDMATFAALDMQDAQKALGKEMDNANYEHAKEEVEKWRKELELAKNTKLEPVTENTIIGKDFFNKKAPQDIKTIETRLAEAEKELEKWNNAVDKAQGKTLGDLGIKDLVNNLLEAKDKVEETPVEPKVVKDSIDDAIASANGLLGKIQNIDVDKVVVDVEDNSLKDVNYLADDFKDRLNEIDLSETSVYVDRDELIKAKEEAMGAIDELKNLDTQIADPEVKREKIEEAEKKLRAALQRMKDLKQAKAYPKVEVPGLDKLIEKLEKAWGLIKRLTGQEEKKNEGKGSQKPVSSSNKNDTKEEIRKKVEAANSDDDIDGLLSELNKGKKKSQYGSEERKFFNEQIKKLQEKKKKNDTSSQNKDAKEKQTRNAKEIADELKFQEQMADIQRQGIRARIDAKIAAERNNYLREKQQRDEQHKRTLDDLKNQETDIFKEIYNKRKQDYENKNSKQGLKYENTDVGAAGWLDPKAQKQMMKDFSDNEKKLYDGRMAIINAKRDEESEKEKQRIYDEQKERLKAMREYFKEYGSFEQQRMAITQEYEDEISKLRKEGKNYEADAKQEELKKRQGQMSFENVSKNIDWYTLFNGVGNMSKQMMQQAMGQLHAYVNTEDFKNAGAENQQKIADLMGELREYLGSEGNGMTDLASAMIEFNEVLDEFKQAQEAEKIALTALSVAQTNESDAKARLEREEISEAEYNEFKKALNKAKEAAKNAGKAVSDGQKNVEMFGANLNKASDAVVNYTSKLDVALKNAEGILKNVQGFSGLQNASKQISEFKGQIDKANAELKAERVKNITAENSGLLIDDGMGNAVDEKFADNIAQDIASSVNVGSEKILSGISGIVGGASSFLSDGLMNFLTPAVSGILALPRLILTVVNAVKDFVTDILDSFTELLRFEWLDDLINSILDALFNLIDTIFDLPENIANSLGRILEGVGNFVGNVFHRVASVFGLGGSTREDHEEGYQNTINEMTGQLDANTKALDRNTDALKNNPEHKTIKEMEDILNTTIKQIQDDRWYKLALAKEIANDSYSGTWWKLGSDGYHSWNNLRGEASELNAFNDTLARKGSSKRLYDSTYIFGLTPEEIQWLMTNNPQEWRTFFGDIGSERNPQEIQYWLEQYAETAKREREQYLIFYEQLTQISFDSLRDNFKSSILDMSKTAKDFIEDFEKMMADAQLEAMFNIEGADGKSFSDKIEDWQLKWGELMRNDGKLTEDEIRLLREEYKALQDEAIGMRKEVRKVTGYGTNHDRNTAESNSIKNISYEQADSLIGIELAKQMILEQMLRIMRGLGGEVYYEGGDAYSAQTYTEVRMIRENLEYAVQDIRAINTDGMKTMNDFLAHIVTILDTRELSGNSVMAELVTQILRMKNGQDDYIAKLFDDKFSDLFKKYGVGTLEDLLKKADYDWRIYNDLRDRGVDPNMSAEEIMAAIAQQGQKEYSTLFGADNDWKDQLAEVLMVANEQDNANTTFLTIKAEQLSLLATEHRDIAADSRDILAGMAIHVEEIRDGVVDTIVPRIKNIDDNLESVYKIVREA